MVHEENFLALVKGCERYVFFYDNEIKSVRCLFEIFNRYALDDECNFNEYDASFLTKQVEESQNNHLLVKDRLEQIF